MDALLQDLRYAFRTLIENPGFSVLTMACLALGIGVNSTIFSVVDTVAIRPMPFRDAHQLLASIGVYGVLSYTVSQRTQEIGVRMALGASRQKVFSLIVSQGARLAGVGILFGVAGAVGVTRVIQTFLYNVSATDPLSFLLTAVFLTLVAVVAAWIPARRATAVDPMIALRAE
jgi:hypothetical protein